MASKAKRATFVTQLDLKNVKSFLGPQILDLTDKEGRPARWTLIVGDNGVGKTTLLECLAHLAPVFNSDDKDSSADPIMFIEPLVAAEPNSVIEYLGRNGDIDFKIEATFAVDSRLDTGDASKDTLETSLTFSRTGGEVENIVASTWGKEHKIPQSEWNNYSKFRTPLILAYGAGRHMGVGNLDFEEAPLDSPALTRLIDEVRSEEAEVPRSYNRTYNRHNR